MFLKKCRRKRG